MHPRIYEDRARLTDKGSKQMLIPFLTRGVRPIDSKCPPRLRRTWQE
jgi:hypothetical protein